MVFDVTSCPLINVIPEEGVTPKGGYKITDPKVVINLGEKDKECS